jgi:hypothetical protein
VPETEAAGTSTEERGAGDGTNAEDAVGGTDGADGTNAADGTDGTNAADGTDTDVRSDHPYRAEVVRGDGEWHLTVQSLDNHPDRGEVDALVITVTPDGSGDDFPATDLDRTLTQCGFTRHGDWTSEGERWGAPCRQPHTRAAPPAPPIDPEP